MLSITIQFNSKTKLFLLSAIISLLSVGVVSVISFTIISAQIKSAIKSSLKDHQALVQQSFVNTQEANRSAIQGLAQSPNVVMAFQAMHQGFSGLSGDLKLKDMGLSSIRTTIMKTYQTLPTAVDENQANLKPADYCPVMDRALLLQYLYLYLNPQQQAKRILMDDAGDGSRYSRAHQMFHPFFRKEMYRFRFSDVCLVDDQSGTVFYSAAKEIDFGANLFSNAYSKTPLAIAYSQSLATSGPGIWFTDVFRYVPAQGNPSQFVIAPIFAQGKRVGTLLVRMPAPSLLVPAAGQSRSQIADYLIGSDLRMRSSANYAAFEIPCPVFSTIVVSGALPRKSQIRTVINPAGRRGLALVTPVSNTGYDGYLVSEYPVRSILMAQLVWFGRILVVGLALLALLIPLMMWIFKKSILSPLEALEDSLTKVKNGESIQSIPSSNLPEINHIIQVAREALDYFPPVFASMGKDAEKLIMALNEMIHVAQAARQNIQHTVADSESLKDSFHLYHSTVLTMSDSVQSAHQLLDDTNQYEANISTSLNDTLAQIDTTVRPHLVDVKHTQDYLSQCISQFDRIVQTMKEMVSQAQILSINAATEAASAGPFSQGFTILADELRTFAERFNRWTQDVGLISKGLSRYIATSQESLNAGVGAVAALSVGVQQIQDQQRSLISASEQMDIHLTDLRPMLTRLTDMGVNYQSTYENMADRQQAVESHVLLLQERLDTVIGQLKLFRKRAIHYSSDKEAPNKVSMLGNAFQVRSAATTEDNGVFA